MKPAEIDNDAAEFLTAMITHGAEEPTGLVQRLGDDRVFALIAAASMVAVTRKFSSSTPVSEMQIYVADLKQRFRDNTSEIKPAMVEAVIRSAFGEEQLLEGLNRDDIISTMFMLTYAIMSYENLQDEELDQYVNEVIQLADTA